jgi:hypothetical protein
MMHVTTPLIIVYIPVATGDRAGDEVYDDSACDGEDDIVNVCGTCGFLFYSS